MSEKIRVSKRTIINKFGEGIEEAGWDILTHYHNVPMTEVFKEVFQYLESKGIEVK